LRNRRGRREEEERDKRSVGLGKVIAIEEEWR
jgi:hypothetical protein